MTRIRNFQETNDFFENIDILKKYLNTLNNIIFNFMSYIIDLCMLLTWLYKSVTHLYHEYTGLNRLLSVRQKRYYRLMVLSETYYWFSRVIWD